MHETSKLIQVAYSTAVRATIEASRVMMPFWPNPLNPRFDEQKALEVVTKDEGVGNFATAADILAEQKIIDEIRQVPELETHSISAEETGDITGDGQWRWSVDPIDGSMNFLKGLPDFGICIALFNGDRVVVGVIAIPALRQLVAVKKDEDAKLFSYDGIELANLSRLAQRHSERLEETIVGYNLGYAHRDQQLIAIARKLVTKVGQASSLGSFALGNFRVVQGMMGAYFGTGPTVMDIAPAAALLPAVGGVVTDMSGNEIDWSASTGTYLGAVNARIHEQFLAAMS